LKSVKLNIELSKKRNELNFPQFADKWSRELVFHITNG